ncbi:MAG: hypothetical protein IH886_13740 [Nitrospinae bacterium]|nr:hypothetical protein [Nitrospinota bacterium]MCH8209213.1 hypothetical protein [Nitrospinota bacterium]
MTTANQRLIRPKKLSQGDKVGVVAPAGPVDLQELVDVLDAKGVFIQLRRIGPDEIEPKP